MKNQRTKGVLLALLSGVLFGLNPLVAKTAYAGGSNPTTMILVRFTVNVVVFFLLFKITGGQSIKITKRELKSLIAPTLGYAFTPVLLLTSYQYLDSGLATTIHFVYPALILLGGFLVQRRLPSIRSAVCCALCLAGISCFVSPGGNVSLSGILIAFVSGVVYSVYALSLDISEAGKLPVFKLAFWINLFSLPLPFLLSPLPFLEDLAFQVTPLALGMMLLYGVLSAVGSYCFQKSVVCCDAATTSLLSTFEPLTSVVLGILVYHEAMNARSAFGIVLILLSVFLVAFAGKKKTE